MLTRTRLQANALVRLSRQTTLRVGFTVVICNRVTSSGKLLSKRVQLTPLGSSMTWKAPNRIIPYTPHLGCRQQCGMPDCKRAGGIPGEVYACKPSSRLLWRGALFCRWKMVKFVQWRRRFWATICISTTLYTWHYLRSPRKPHHE